MIELRMHYTPKQNRICYSKIYLYSILIILRNSHSWSISGKLRIFKRN